MNWDKLQTLHANLSFREKTLTLLSIIGLIVFSTVNFILQPMFEQYAQLKKTEVTVSNSIKSIQTQIKIIDNKLALDPVLKIQQQLDNLNRQHQSKIKELDKYKLALVSSDEMASLVEEVVEENSELLVVLLTSKEPVPILIDNKKDEQHVLLYKHGIDIKLKGQYFSLLAFMEKIEKKEKSILWSDIDYRVEEYPNAILSFEIYTISTDKEFIGVKK